MSRRKRTGILLIMVGLGLGAWRLTASLWTDATPSPGVTAENFALLRQGVTRSAVEAILGGKGFAEPESFPDTYYLTWHSGPEWQTARVRIHLYFRSDNHQLRYGQITCVDERDRHTTWAIPDSRATLLSRLRRRLRL